MEKKLTKKELKELEEKQNELRKLRRYTVSSYKSLMEDIEATKRYYKINNMEDKLTLYGRLIDEEQIKLLRNYDKLNFLKHYSEYTEEEKKNGDDRAWTFIREMYNSYNEFEEYTENKYIKACDKDGLIISEIIWTDRQMKLYLQLAKKFGYKNIYYNNSGSGALSDITTLVKLGAKVIGTCETQDKDKDCLIFDITEVNIAEE